MVEVEPKPRAVPARQARVRLGPRGGVLIGAFAAAVVVGLLLVSALSQTAPRLADIEPTRAANFFTVLAPKATVCEAGLPVPPDAGAVSVVVGLFKGSWQPLSLTVTDARGIRTARVTTPYAHGQRIIAPLSGDRRASASSTLCIRNDGAARVGLGGLAERKVVRRRADVSDRLAVSWYRPGSESWWSVAPIVAERSGRVKAGWIGTWTIWAALAAVLACGALAVATVARAGRRLRVALCACAVVGFVNAVAWTVVTPPFHVPDEHKHVAYADNLGTTGRPPTTADLQAGNPADVMAGLTATEYPSVVFDSRMRPPWTSAEDAAAEKTLTQPLSRAGGAEGATYYPPLYYAAAAAAARIDDSGTVLDRMTLMRVASALFTGIAAFFVALFTRELLPSRPWAWTAAGMVAAFQPMFGFIGGGVNNDSLLFAASAALLFVVARASRCGLDVRLAAAAGAALAVGVLTKATMVALVPLVCFGLFLSVWIRRRQGRPVPWTALGTLALVTVAPLLVYSLVNGLVWDRGFGILGGAGGSPSPSATASAAAVAAPGGSATAATAPPPWQLREFVSYTWQFYLPRLSFMNDKFGTDLPLWEVWFKGWVGRFGWQDTEFSNDFYRLAFKVWLAVIALALVGLWRHRAGLRRRWVEVLTYVAGLGGVLVVLHYVGYDYWLDTGVGFEQARYLLVLLPLYAGFVALAVAGGGRRLGPVIAGALVVLALGNSVAGLLLTVSRYYG